MSMLKQMTRILEVFKQSKGYDANILKHVSLVEASKGKIKCEMVVQDEHLNGYGTLHGGCSATIIDSVSSFAFVTMDDNQAGVSCDINASYIKGAKVGETIVIKSDVLKGFGRVRFANVDICNQAGELLVTGRHTKFMR